MNTRRIVPAVFVLSMIFSLNAHADLSPEQLAKIAQNPLFSLVSVPFQFNAYPDFGPQKDTLKVLDIEPVIPFHVSDDFYIITRTILPAIWVPPVYPGGPSTSGVGDIQPAAYVVPAHHGDWVWGAGVFSQIPTHSNSLLGNDHWGVGPSAGAIHSNAQSPWVFGALLANYWSVGTDKNSPTYNNGFIQLLANYNLPGGKGTYLLSNSLITVDWKAEQGRKLTLPLGGGIGQIVHLGKLPVNLSLTGYYNVYRQALVGDWQIQVQATLMFPKL